MGIPQLCVIALYMLSLGIHLAKHGESQTGRFNFWTALLTGAIMFGLLWWGDFFS